MRPSFEEGDFIGLRPRDTEWSRCSRGRGSNFESKSGPLALLDEAESLGEILRLRR